MSSNVLASSTPTSKFDDGRTGLPATRAHAGRTAFATLAPVAIALLALLLHHLLPNRVAPPRLLNTTASIWNEPYPLLLVSLLAASALLALAQSLWAPLRPWAIHHAPLLAGALLIVALWDLLTRKLDWMVLPFFPDPGLVLHGLIDDRAVLFVNTQHSLLLLLTGYASGAAAGVITGVFIGWFPRVRYWAMPALKIVGPLPATALVPLAMTLFASSFLCGVALIGFAVWFPVTMLTSSGISNVRLSYLDVARTLGANQTFLIFRVAVPAALPNIFIGLFMGLSVSFLTLIVAESVGVRAGLGHYLKMQQGYAEYANVYAALAITAVFSSALMTILFMVRERVLKWQKGVIKW